LSGDSVLNRFRARARTRELYRVHRRLAAHTMLARNRFVNNLLLAETVATLPGVVVECGVWKGGMIAGLAMILGTHRTYYLCDTFEGLPPAQDIDGSWALKWQGDQRDRHSPLFMDNARADERHAIDAMSMAGVSNYRILKGLFADTLPGIAEESIALLRLDGDWYESTMTCLESLFAHVVKAGLIIIDDYLAFEGCAKAVHDFLSKRQLPERIQQFNNDVIYIRKGY
jgi:O-methyltransferase